jgi:hypothetical protein
MQRPRRARVLRGVQFSGFEFDYEVGRMPRIFSGAAIARTLVGSLVVCNFACSPSSPTPTAPDSNRPAAVAISFPAGDSCAPTRTTPCAIEVVAQASDPDGDALRFSWSGCAAGTDARARCTVAAPGSVTATVTIDDQHGHVSSASATVTGINGLPDLFVGHILIPPAGQGEIDILGNVMDPEDGLVCGREYCGSVSSTGACGRASVECTCLAGLEIRIERTATTGVCSVSLEVKDKWGATGTPTVSFDVGTLRLLSHTTSVVATRK